MYNIREGLDSIRESLIGSKVYCPVECPIGEEVYRILYNDFRGYKLKELVSLRKEGMELFKYTYVGGTISKKERVKGTGSLKSREVRDILKGIDMYIGAYNGSNLISLISVLYSYGVSYLVVGEIRYAMVRRVEREIEKGRVHVGTSYPVKGDTYKVWYSNMSLSKDSIISSSKYSPEDYPIYLNYEAIEVSRLDRIPLDYIGVMGVPVTYYKYHSKDYEILGNSRYCVGAKYFKVSEYRDGVLKGDSVLGYAPVIEVPVLLDKGVCYEYGGRYYKQLYDRVFIRRRR